MYTPPSQFINDILYKFCATCFKPRKEGDKGLFITLVPKVLNDVFFFFGLTSNEFRFIKLTVQTFQPKIVI